MGDRVVLDPALAPALSAGGLARAEGLFGLAGPLDRSSVVTEVEIPIPGTVGRFHLKRYAYDSWRRSKGLFGRGTLFGSAPEIQEMKALQWLREHQIPAVRPIAAASRTRRGRLVAHLLLTEHVENARDLAARLRDPMDPLRTDAAARARALGLVAHHLAQMHAEGFVHRDAHPRNVLVRVDEDVRVWFLDCRRGGTSGRRGPLGDLATMDLDLEGLVTRTERLRALATYLPLGAPTRKTHEKVAALRDKRRRADARRGRARR